MVHIYLQILIQLRLHNHLHIFIQLLLHNMLHKLFQIKHKSNLSYDFKKYKIIKIFLLTKLF